MSSTMARNSRHRPPTGALIRPRPPTPSNFSQITALHGGNLPTTTANAAISTTRAARSISDFFPDPAAFDSPPTTAVNTYCDRRPPPPLRRLPRPAFLRRLLVAYRDRHQQIYRTAPTTPPRKLTVISAKAWHMEFSTKISKIKLKKLIKLKIIIV
ncbi:hypothetical protein F511_27363 [Dorcoceras hygrometricum]|uniref:Uncharacterized protein n=1 Tax=Dorcoceras hygrometricum TaxID=472368 RepID=A0A2Z7DIJ2_9LAMI|nr:hypothetical protein F511_27363 [Dorcoceras hygrometricum]